MPALVRPTVEVRGSFLAAMAEHVAAGDVPGYVNPETPFAELREHRDRWHTPEGFAGFVAWALSLADAGTPMPPGLVPSLELWWVDGVEYLGRVSIRTPLTDALREDGGNIGYDVRPTARGRGHATAMLAAALPVAHGLGIDPALVTVAEGNAASLAVVRRNGGEVFERSGSTLKFWVPTGPTGPVPADRLSSEQGHAPRGEERSGDGQGDGEHQS